MNESPTGHAPEHSSIEADDLTLTVHLNGTEGSPSTALTVSTNWFPGQSLCHTTINGATRVFQVREIAEGFELRHRGSIRSTRLMSKRKAQLADLMLEKEPEDTSNLLLCPMPGLLVSLLVKEGDTVEEGQALAMIEAMKMENVLTAARSGTIAAIPTKAGQSLGVDDVILEFES